MTSEPGTKTDTVPAPDSPEDEIECVWWNRKQTQCAFCVEHDGWIHIYTCRSKTGFKRERVGILSLEDNEVDYNIEMACSEDCHWIVVAFNRRRYTFYDQVTVTKIHCFERLNEHYSPPVNALTLPSNECSRIRSLIIVKNVLYRVSAFNVHGRENDPDVTSGDIAGFQVDRYDLVRAQYLTHISMKLTPTVEHCQMMQSKIIAAAKRASESPYSSGSMSGHFLTEKVHLSDLGTICLIWQSKCAVKLIDIFTGKIVFSHYDDKGELLEYRWANESHILLQRPDRLMMFSMRTGCLISSIAAKNTKLYSCVVTCFEYSISEPSFGKVLQVYYREEWEEFCIMTIYDLATGCQITKSESGGAPVFPLLYRLGFGKLGSISFNKHYGRIFDDDEAKFPAQDMESTQTLQLRLPVDIPLDSLFRSSCFWPNDADMYDNTQYLTGELFISIPSFPIRYDAYGPGIRIRNNVMVKAFSTGLILAISQSIFESRARILIGWNTIFATNPRKRGRFLTFEYCTKFGSSIQEIDIQFMKSDPTCFKGTIKTNDSTTVRPFSNYLSEYHLRYFESQFSKRGKVEQQQDVSLGDSTHTLSKLDLLENNPTHSTTLSGCPTSEHASIGCLRNPNASHSSNLDSLYALREEQLKDMKEPH
ncbi:hypothetical protein BZG36_03967 [Bifiguratus adelaidae]|uniref:Uncharacterized protein n=1 Tax=Bifiguratus adelaidae TaxID=1938954 RepID=A0A261XXG7_9FUNG|nr:hypothetical protein BZG36_03967 [Bifiguratus adelaidae]